MAAAGTLFILAGLAKLTHGEFEGTNYLGQPVYSTSLIVVGVLIALCAFIPSSWLSRSAKRTRDD